MTREIYICAGQSNMSGRGLLSEAPLFQNSSRIWCYTNAGTWENPATEPIDTSAGQVDAVSIDTDAAAGPIMAFADWLAQARPNVEIGVVPCTKGGSWMRDWARDWRRTTLYGSMIARAREAAKAGELKGLLWYQGESDTADLQAVIDWPARFVSLVSAVRLDLNIPNLPVVFTRLGPEPNIHPFVNWGRMQLYQSQISAPGLAMVDASDLSVQSDKLHLDTASLVVLGRRYAGAMYALLSK
jgi:hypothetical protein